MIHVVVRDEDVGSQELKIKHCGFLIDLSPLLYPLIQGIFPTKPQDAHKPRVGSLKDRVIVCKPSHPDVMQGAFSLFF
jgi:hypothetical protein